MRLTSLKHKYLVSFFLALMIWDNSYQYLQASTTSEQDRNFTRALAEIAQNTSTTDSTNPEDYEFSEIIFGETAPILALIKALYAFSAREKMRTEALLLDLFSMIEPKNLLEYKQITNSIEQLNKLEFKLNKNRKTMLQYDNEYNRKMTALMLALNADIKDFDKMSKSTQNRITTYDFYNNFIRDVGTKILEILTLLDSIRGKYEVNKEGITFISSGDLLKYKSLELKLKTLLEKGKTRAQQGENSFQSLINTTLAEIQ